MNKEPDITDWLENLPPEFWEELSKIEHKAWLDYEEYERRQQIAYQKNKDIPYTI